MPLQPALSLKARVSYAKEVGIGESLSYGLHYRLAERSVVATVPVGYADGVPRRLFMVGGEVLIGGRRRPVAGAVTMDQILVDCGPGSDVARGDEVVLLGRQGEAEISPWEWAERLGTIAYEVTCGLSPRLPRLTPHGDGLYYPARVGAAGDLARDPSPVPALLEMAKDASACTRCRLASGRTNVVFGMGSPTAALMFVGEGPGQQEDLQGLPFVGRSGQLLDRLILEEMNLTRDDFYITNTVKCRPPGNRDPLPDEIEACWPYLERQLGLVDPRVVVTLGNFATRSLLGRTEGISKLRGRAYPYRSGYLVPTFHPSAALRGGGGVVAQIRADLVRAKEALAAVPSPRPAG
jgi:DNA polymerase